MIRLALATGSALAFFLSGCTASPGTNGYSYLSGGTNNSSSSSSSSSSNSGGGFVDPFNPPAGAAGDSVVLTVPGANGGSIVAWTQQRCGGQAYNDSLAKWVGGSTKNTNIGRFDWSENYTGSLTINSQPYSYYYGIAKAIRDNGGFNTTPLYPTFDRLDSNGVPVAFTGLLTGANPQDPAGDPADTRTSLGSGHKLLAFCIASCYRGNVPLYFHPQAQTEIRELSQDAIAYPVEQARQQWLGGNPMFASVVTLSPSSVFGAVGMISTLIRQFSTDLVDNDPQPQLFYRIQTGEGHSITVTENHGLMAHGGLVRTAQDIVASFRAGHPESLITALNGEEAIVSVQDLRLNERSFNVLTAPPSDSEEPLGDVRQHLVVSGDGRFISADSLEQNRIDELNREMDRAGMIDPANP